MRKDIKCRLCLQREADQTGSHIFTHSWIKSAINEAGQTRRNKEITFSIGLLSLVDSYIGREVQPDNIEEVLNKEMTDDEIKNNTNYFTIDNIVCKECEKRFSTAENYFNDSFYVPLKQRKLAKKKDGNGNEIIEIGENRIEIDIIRLNILIQFWRASVSNYEGFRFEPIMEEKLRKIIDLNIELDFKKTVINCQKNSEKIRSIPLIITFMETEIKSKSAIELTTNIVFVGKEKMPYFFVINDICIQLYEKESHLKSTIQNLFGLNHIINRFEHVNHNEKLLKIGVLNEIYRMKLLTNFRELLTNQMIHTLSSFFSYWYQRVHGFKPSRDTCKAAIRELVYNTKTCKYDRYTAQNVVKSFAKMICEDDIN